MFMRCVQSIIILIKLSNICVVGEKTEEFGFFAFAAGFFSSSFVRCVIMHVHIF